MIRLKTIIDGLETEHAFRGATVKIGRAKANDLAYPDLTSLSRQHCRIDLVQGHCEVTDLSSTNGLQVNGLFMRRGVVEVGDRLLIGVMSIEILGFGTDAGEPEQIRPCLDCGYLIPVNDLACPRCSGSVMLKRRHRISRDHIRGYDLTRKIGSGGMGIVFEATRRSDRQTTALKILKPHLARDPRYLVRFVEETRVLTLLEHPNIVRIFGRGSDGGLIFIDMELVAGDSVRGIVTRDGRIPERRALQMVREVVLALDFAARKKIVHGDVKPSNFLYDETSGAVKLCDFGLAQLLDLSTPATHRAAESGAGKGTAAYAAPERFEKGAIPTIVGDIYSVGASLFQMLTGELPFGTNRFSRRRGAGVAGTPPNPRELVAEIRPATGMFVQRLLASKPEDRYPSYRDLLDDLAILL